MAAGMWTAKGKTPRDIAAERHGEGSVIVRMFDGIDDTEQMQNDSSYSNCDDSDTMGNDAYKCNVCWKKYSATGNLH